MMAYFIRLHVFILVKISHVYWMTGLPSINYLFPKPPSGIIYLYCMKLPIVKTILLFIASWDSSLSWKVCVQELFVYFDRLWIAWGQEMIWEWTLKRSSFGKRKDEFTNRLFVLISMGNSRIVKWQHTVKLN